MLEDIDSEVSYMSHQSETESESSQFSSLSRPSAALTSNDVGLIQEVDESLIFQKNEDLKRYFYTCAI